MDPGQANNKRQKMVASFIVIMAVVIVTVGVSALNKNTKPSTASAATNKTSDTTNTPAQSTNTSTQASTSDTSSSTTTANASGYKDGSYSANSNYQTPGGTEGITVNIILQNGAVTSSSIENRSNNRESEEYQSAFDGGYKSFVVGKKLGDIGIINVSGSSLTAEGFDEALQQIKSQAQTS